MLDSLKKELNREAGPAENAATVNQVEQDEAIKLAIEQAEKGDVNAALATITANRNRETFRNAFLRTFSAMSVTFENESLYADFEIALEVALASSTEETKHLIREVRENIAQFEKAEALQLRKKEVTISSIGNEIEELEKTERAKKTAASEAKKALEASKSAAAAAREASTRFNPKTKHSDADGMMSLFSIGGGILAFVLSLSSCSSGNIGMGAGMLFLGIPAFAIIGMIAGTVIGFALDDQAKKDNEQRKNDLDGEAERRESMEREASNLHALAVSEEKNSTEARVNAQNHLEEARKDLATEERTLQRAHEALAICNRLAS